MTDRKVTKRRLEQFEICMIQAEKRKSTIEKYMRDVRKLQRFAGERDLTKELLLQYKDALYKSGRYHVASINSFLAAANYFCTCMQWTELHVKLFRIQQDAFLPEKRELSVQEYQRLIGTAMQRGEERLAMLIQTIGSTGMRISELPNVTVESLEEGMTEIYSKGKTRRILFPGELIELLTCYAGRHHIRHGCIFRTYTGKPLDRCNIWRDMKRLCEYAGVSPEKVYPHNLRHLFARRFYEINQDIAKLADILGHSSIETTRIYIKSTGREHKKLLDQMRLVYPDMPAWDVG